jgi:hypothetical protein
VPFAIAIATWQDISRENKKMKNRQWMGGIVIAIGAVGSAAFAADLANLSGQSCGASTGEWHFVNNQTGGATAAGTLTATFSSGDSCTVTASKVNQNTQHFYCIAAGALQSASTNLPGRLVLSDFTCGKKEPPPPPPK